MVRTPSYIPVEQLLAKKKIISVVLAHPIFRVKMGPDETFVKRCLEAVAAVMGQMEESDVAALGAGTSLAEGDKPDVAMTEESSLTEKHFPSWTQRSGRRQSRTWESRGRQRYFRRPLLKL